MKRVHVCSTPGCPELEPCPTHARARNERWSRDRDPVAQGRFRSAVMTRAQGWCERCGKRPATVAHHVRPGYEPGFGQALCDDCHMQVDEKARRTGTWG